jgi:hypothetical protein
MSVRSREVKILAAFLSSLTAGLIILMALGNAPPPAGAFCLSGYYGLDSVEKAIFSRLSQPLDRWGRIVVYYSGTEGHGAEQLPSAGSLTSPEESSCHFVVNNGFGGADGQIQPTEKWLRQCSIVPGGGRTVHICVIANGVTTRPTDVQIKRVDGLVATLCREFNIEPEAVRYPNDWH